MRWLENLIAPLARLLGRLGVCANAGILVGMLTGGLVTLVDMFEGPLALSVPELLRYWLILALFCWTVLLFLLVPLTRWTFSSVALPALVNAVLVSGLTLFLARALGLYAWAWWLGIAVGLAVGLLLCGLYRYAARG